MSVTVGVAIGYTVGCCGVKQLEGFSYPDDDTSDAGWDIEATGKDDGLVIWGGADISPSIYGEPVGPRTGAGHEPSFRDRTEMAAVDAAIKVGIPLIGVCRGAQLMCAMSGGKLVQDVQGHMGSH